MTKATVAQLYLNSTLVSVAAREARAGFGLRVAVTSPQPDFRGDQTLLLRGPLNGILALL